MLTELEETYEDIEAFSFDNATWQTQLGGVLFSCEAKALDGARHLARVGTNAGIVGNSRKGKRHNG